VKQYFHITSIGWDADLINGMFDRIQEKTYIRFSHIVLTNIQAIDVMKSKQRSDVIPIRRAMNELLPAPDLDLLASLEKDDVPTIHNMILGDRVLCKLPREEVLSYATLLVHRIKEILETQKPDVVIGGFDSLHSGIGLAVCRRLGIPWMAMGFTTVPKGYMGFCDQISPNALLPIRRPIDDDLKAEASEILAAFLDNKMHVPAYVSSHSMSILLRRAPANVANLIRRFLRTLSMQMDHYTWPSNIRRIDDYLRRLRNMLLLPQRLFLREPPDSCFAIYALQMQPESSIDSWAPFFADQIHLIGQLVRAMPPNMKLLVKLHISDADNYLPAQLRKLTALPGVALVHPTVRLRDFIEHADLVFGVQGTCCLEASLLGKPVLIFGDSPYLKFPRVAQVGCITDLPAQIRTILATPTPTYKEILWAFTQYLARYMPSVYNDWSRPLADDDIMRLTTCFERLAVFIQARTSGDR